MKFALENGVEKGIKAAKELYDDRVVFGIDPGLKNWAGMVAMLGKVEDDGNYAGHFMKSLVKPSRFYHETGSDRCAQRKNKEMQKILDEYRVDDGEDVETSGRVRHADEYLKQANAFKQSQSVYLKINYMKFCQKADFRRERKKEAEILVKL